MTLEETSIAGAFLVQPVPSEDDRGFFARIWCEDEFARHGLNPNVAQASMSYNRTRGTLRGMHWQAPPHEEAKLVRCTAGAVFDVIADVRPDSPTYLCWRAFILSRRNRRMLYIPEGVAHGFQTLEDDTELAYQMSCPYHPESSRGLAWNDPMFGIHWPIPDPILSPKDRSYERIAGYAHV